MTRQSGKTREFERDKLCVCAYVSPLLISIDRGNRLTNIKASRHGMCVLNQLLCTAVHTHLSCVTLGPKYYSNTPPSRKLQEEGLDASTIAVTYSAEKGTATDK